MQKLVSVNETSVYEVQAEYVFKDIFEMKEYVYGAPLVKDGSLAKLPSISEALNENGDCDGKMLGEANEQTSGIRMRFFTDSEDIVLKIHTKRKFSHQKMTMSCSSGFDVYFCDKNGKRTHITVIAQEDGNNVYAHRIGLYGKPRIVEIYFPLYNAVEELKIGFRQNRVVSRAPDYRNKAKVVFYGNSCTQGASASRSGNAYPNIVSRKLDCDIVNYAFSGACRAELAVAERIAENERESESTVGGLVIDYQRNAKNLAEFRDRYEKFYMAMRKEYPDIPIILVGAVMQPLYDDFIEKIHRECRKRKENTFFLKPDSLFFDLDEVAITPDRLHYTDVGMFRVANKICEYLLQSSEFFCRT